MASLLRLRPARGHLLRSALLLLLLLLQLPHAVSSIREDVTRQHFCRPPLPVFREAPAYRNGDGCAARPKVHIAMTLDANYLRGTMAAILSILQHTLCPESITFHFLAVQLESEILTSIRSTFRNLDFAVHRFDQNLVSGRISRSIRQALDQPLNYARIYLADMLPPDVSRVIYLDSDLIVVDDIAILWEVDLEDKVVAAPEYCHANFTEYFTDAFWTNPTFTATFKGRKPCYFNTGVMVMDMAKWREDGYTRRVEGWMAVQKQRQIYTLGSLPPFLLVMAGNIKGVDHRWNQHGLGGDSLEGKCRTLHPGPISLLHWSGKGKPWDRLDSHKPCVVDHLWVPYDLCVCSSTYLEE